MTPLKPKNGQVSVYLILLFLVACIMILGRRCSPENRFISGNRNVNDTINVGLIYGPLSYYLYSDTLGGINYELLKRFEIETQTPLKLWPLRNIDEALDKVAKGKILFLASVSPSHDINNNFLTTENIFLEQFTLVSLKKSLTGKKPLKSVLDLKNDTVYISKDSPAYEKLKTLAQEGGFTIKVDSISRFSDSRLCEEVAQSKIKYAVVSKKVAEIEEQKNLNLTSDNYISFTLQQVWAFNPSDSLIYNKVNNWLDSCMKTQFYKSLLLKY